MSNFKRKKSRRKVKCSLCTPNRYGNSKKSSKSKYISKLKQSKKDIKNYL